MEIAELRNFVNAQMNRADLLHNDTQAVFRSGLADRKTLQDYFENCDQIAKKIEYETAQGEFQQAEAALARARYRYRMASDAVNTPTKKYWPSPAPKAD
jgi:hypothetical protein